jgi:hypothetical protein
MMLCSLGKQYKEKAFNELSESRDDFPERETWRGSPDFITRGLVST